MLLIYMIDLKKKNNLLFVQAIWPDNADIPHISQESYIQVIQFCFVLFSLEGPAHAILRCDGHSNKLVPLQPSALNLE